jgi:hypothetical protein
MLMDVVTHRLVAITMEVYQSLHQGALCPVDNKPGVAGLAKTAYCTSDSQ